MHVLHNGLQVDKSVHKWALAIGMLNNIFLLHTKCKHMTLAISTLKNILPLHTKFQTIIYNIPMCYSKCHNVDIFFSLNRVTYVDEWSFIGN